MEMMEEFFLNLMIVFLFAAMFVLSCMLVDVALIILQIKEITSRNKIIVSVLIALIFLIIAMIMTILF